PAGVTDLKAAVRYVRYNSGIIPGSTEHIFTFGMSGGGAQSALMGATGDSELYTPYLEAIGAVKGVSDAVAGSMCWCPITNLDYANEAYEWNMGLTRTDLDEETRTLSDSLANAFAEYINELGLKDKNGSVLTLSQSESGIYMAGSYYDYIKAEIERSLNNFLEDTTFPYTPQNGKGGFGGGRGGGPRGGMPPVGDIPIEELDGIARTEAPQQAAESVTYQTVQEYIDSLNKNGVWVNYDSASNTATITDVEDFVKNCKNASKSVGAFDDLNSTQGENVLFGYGDGSGAHFDPVMARLLSGTPYGQAYADDLKKTDALGNTVDYRMNMYNPMYYLEDYYEGYKTSNVAKYWRIRVGINQGDTALATETNLALALENYGGTEVDFESVWGLGHVEAERVGSSTENFISWVNECLK
ncbi:MAG: subtype A tannase, partial [Clostridia bacterium]